MLSTLETTRSLIQAAEFEAQRLQRVLSDLKATNEASLKFLETARKMDHRPDIKIRAVSRPDIWQEKADIACALAEEAGDTANKRVLLEIARSYDELAQQSAACS